MGQPVALFHEPPQPFARSPIRPCRQRLDEPPDVRRQGAPAGHDLAGMAGVDEEQRLARHLCANCKAPVEIPREALLEAGFEEEDLDGSWIPYRAVGCQMCNNGYKGRVGIYQVMPINEDMQSLILSDASAMEIAKQAKRDGVRSLRSSGLHKAKMGLTTVAEVLAVTNE